MPTDKSNEPQQAPVHTLKGIMNFRDVGESVGKKADGTRDIDLPPSESYMREGMFFRSATLDGASEADVRLLIDRYKLKTIVDLRSGIEKKDKNEIEMSFPTAVLWHMTPMEILAPTSDNETRRRATASLPVSGDKLLSASPTSPFTPSADYPAVPAHPGVESEVVHGRRTRAALLILFCQKPYAIRLIGQEVMAPKGLTGLYEDFVEGCQEEIVSTLKIFADPSNYPVLVHCTQGKDRTGLTTALVLSILGVPDEVIARDYGHSRKGLEPVYSETVEYMTRAGLGPEFADAPEEVILHILRHISSRHGSVTSFLSAIGFDQVWQDRVRSVVAPKQ
ncbi:protein-tyrosine phosphatase-like protein [Jimgerdemannia flammicorona]|uniref:Protein-tyrosine phosphatase-like protein n=1 Tax=Jimgerdemannia flammicorona TaxID=994334 RepID=A0A433DJ96_9FUNG|nr:protein-tyrosine phosphatase-like protein [Jimgerdemannia flammicorona]